MSLRCGLNSNSVEYCLTERLCKYGTEFSSPLEFFHKMIITFFSLKILYHALS
jgi:hypothetical protein